MCTHLFKNSYYYLHRYYTCYYDILTVKKKIEKNENCIVIESENSAEIFEN